jgi:hypothetical protein
MNFKLVYEQGFKWAGTSAGITIEAGGGGGPPYFVAGPP